MVLVEQLGKKQPSTLRHSNITSHSRRRKLPPVSYINNGAGIEGNNSISSNLNPHNLSTQQQRTINKHLIDLSKENYQENTNSIKIDLPKPETYLPEKYSKQSIYFKKHSKQSNASKYSVRKILTSRKTYSNYIDEDEGGVQNFLRIDVEESRYPIRKMCSVCGYWGKMSCPNCFARYCGEKCSHIHQETSCVKFY